MTFDNLMQKIYSLSGGAENVSSVQGSERFLCIRLKDQSAVNLEALQQMEGFSSVELNRGKLTIWIEETTFKEVNSMPSKDYKKLSEQIIAGVGGAENVTHCFHCVTRLRFSLKNKEAANEMTLKDIEGVAGIKWNGDELQIIIGQDVVKLFEEVQVQLPSSVLGETLDENLDPELTEKKGFSLKKAGSAIISYVSAAVLSTLPLIIAGGLSRTVAVVLGPTLCGIISEDSDLYVFLTMIYDAAFYFMPIAVGYGACKKLKIDPAYGILFGGLLICNDFLALVGGAGFTIYGIPVTVADYSGTILPMLLTVPIVALWIKFAQKHVPSFLSSFVIPLSTVLICAPVMFLICAPVGNVVGQWIASVYSFFDTSTIVVTIIGTTIFSAIWPFAVMCGMHMVVLQLSIISFAQVGYMGSMGVVTFAYQFCLTGMALSAFLKIKDKKEKGDALSYLMSIAIGSVSEPTLYGIALHYKNGLVALVASCGISGLVCGILRVKMYTVGGLPNVITAIATFAGGSTYNMIAGIAFLVVCIVSGAILGYFIPDYAVKRA